MLDSETVRKLRLLNMGEFYEAVMIQEQQPEVLALPFEDRFQLLTDTVFQEKQNRKIASLIKKAKLRFPKADLCDIYYDSKVRPTLQRPLGSVTK